VKRRTCFLVAPIGTAYRVSSAAVEGLLVALGTPKPAAAWLLWLRGGLHVAAVPGRDGCSGTNTSPQSAALVFCLLQGTPLPS